MRKIFVIVLLAAAACGPKNLPPESQKLFVAISIVDGIQAIQSATIDANKLQLVSDEDAVQIVKYTKAAGLTVGQAPAGWQATVVSGWDALNKAVPLANVGKSQTLRILWASFSAVIEQLRKAPTTPPGEIMMLVPAVS